MSDVLQLATDHFDKLRGQKVEVPEWGEDGAPLVIHFDPVSLLKRQQIQSQAKGKEARMLALTVIKCAKFENGEAMFKDNAEVLGQFERKIDPKVVARIAAAMLQMTDGDDLGNS